jgi:hypothetical protein
LFLEGRGEGRGWVKNGQIGLSQSDIRGISGVSEEVLAIDIAGQGEYSAECTGQVNRSKTMWYLRAIIEQSELNIPVANIVARLQADNPTLLFYATANEIVSLAPVPMYPGQLAWPMWKIILKTIR